MSVEQVKAIGAEFKERRVNTADQLIVVVFGKVGVGKSSVANEVARRLGTASLSSDEYRRKRFGGVQYEPSQSDMALKEMIDKAQELFDNGAKSIVLDATFSKFEAREMARNLAERNDKKILWLEVVCDEGLAGKGNIDGEYVSRQTDEITDIKTRMVIDNSVRTQDVGEQMKILVDSFMETKTDK